MEQTSSNAPFMPVMEGIPAEIMLPKPGDGIPAPEPDGMLFLNGFGAVRARKVMVASLHFLPKATRFMHSKRRWFTIAASQNWEPTYCPVYDSQQAVPTNHGPEGSEFAPMPVTVESIVRDLVEGWGMSGTGVLGRHRAGIMAIAGEKANPQETAQMRKWQEALDRALVEEADQFFASGKGEISEIHRLALAQLGSERRNWFRPIEIGTMKTSIISGNRIPMEALFDGACDLLEYYVKNDIDPVDIGDTFAAVMLERDNYKLRNRIQRRFGVVPVASTPPRP